MPDQETLALTCPTCEQSIDDCECVTCGNSRCGAQVESVCSRCEQCDDCCECSTCDACNERVESVCSRCDCCDSCCECYCCDHCGARVPGDDFCGECDRCTSCCSCNSSSVDTFDGHLAFHSSKPTQFKLNPSRRFIALEVEVARGDSSDMRSTLRHWGDSLVEDGSLPEEGWELNLNPSNGDQFLTHTREIAAALSEANARADTSCGMHCHVDARDFGWFDLFKLCRLYGKVEDGLFSLCSRSRQSNHYCMKCAETYSFEDYKTFKRDLIRKLYGWTPGKLKPCTCYGKTHRGAHKNGNYRGFQERDEKYNGARYHALNLHSFFYRQTVEFRHHHGTVDAKKMQGWGMVCASVMDSASRMTLAEIDALPTDGFSALLRILSPSLREWVTIRAAELNNKGE